MPRNLMISVYDRGQDPGVSIAGGAWETQLPATNMLRTQPQLVAQATGATASFTLNLGTTRPIGAVHLQRLITDPGATISIPGFTAGAVSAWPADAAGIYNPLINAALGRQRVFIPPAPVLTNSISISINGAIAPLQIGFVGACEMMTLPVNMDYNWKIDLLDESDIQKTPFGSTYVVLRARRRRLNLGVGFLRQGGIYGNGADQLFAPFDAAVIAGRSFPVLVAPLPDDTDNLERTAVWGLSTNDQEFANPFFATWATTYQIEQLA